ncbi:MAG TPA: DUF438 domain-containing protein [Rectinemataceae bacterium]
MENSIDPARQEALRGIIRKLHEGKPAQEVKSEFAALIKNVSATEVAAMEQALIDGGMPVEEVQRLCEVHVSVFEASLAKGAKPSGMPGHPIHSMLQENRKARELIGRLMSGARAWRWGVGSRENALDALAEIGKIVVHYTRKENQLFPYLEKQGFTGPSRVMWGKHDEIRAALKTAEAASLAGPKQFLAAARKAASAMRKMIFMEERILLPEAARRLSEREWAEIRMGEEAIGYAWIQPASIYDAAIVMARTKAASAPVRAPGSDSATPGAPGADLIELATGLLPRLTLDAALRTMPMDISIVGPDDKVLYYSDNPHRIFPRSPAAIGRSVQNCHPQKSVHIVEKILEDFKKGSRDKARFWIQMGGRFILIEYYALRSPEGEYLGTLEASQDLTELRTLEGQKRLLD